MSDGGGGNTTTTQKFEPPSWTQQGWQDALTRQRELSSEPFQQSQVPRLAAMNTLQDTGLRAMADFGLNGTPYGNQARQTGLQTLQGAFLDSNPYLNAGHVNSVINDNAGNMAQAFATGTAAQNDALANMQGAYGGSGWQQKQSMDAQGLARSVGQMANQTRMGYDQMGVQNWQNERGLMNSAMQQSPGFENQDFNALKAVTGAGDAYNANEQRNLDDINAQWQQQLNYPQQQLQQYLNVLSQASGTNGGGGGSITGTQSVPGMSPLAGLLGLGTAGLALKTGGFF